MDDCCRLVSGQSPNVQLIDWMDVLQLQEVLFDSLRVQVSGNTWYTEINNTTPLKYALQILYTKQLKRRTSTYPPARWLRCLAWCGSWWREPERRRCRCRWDQPASTPAGKTQVTSHQLKSVLLTHTTCSSNCVELWLLLLAVDLNPRA